MPLGYQSRDPCMLTSRSSRVSVAGIRSSFGGSVFIHFRFSALVVLLIHGLGCLAWWALLWASPSFRAAFAFGDVPAHVFDGLFLADAALYAGLALLGALLIWRGSD